MRWYLALFLGLLMVSGSLQATEPLEKIVTPPYGEWRRSTRWHDISLVIRPNCLKIEVLRKKANDEKVVIEADFGITKDSILFGVTTAYDEPHGVFSEIVSNQSNVDAPFRLRFRVDDEILIIKDVRGLLPDGDCLPGRYLKLKDKALPINPSWESSTKSHRLPDNLQQAGTRSPTVKRSSADKTANVPIPPWVAERLEEKFYYPNGDRTPILPPLKDGEKRTCAKPPDLAAILRAMASIPSTKVPPYTLHRGDFDHKVEKLVDHIDPPRFYPLIGLAQLHHVHWRCTVFYTETVEWPSPLLCTSKRRRSEVIYIDRDHLHRVDVDVSVEQLRALLRNMINDRSTVRELSGKQKSESALQMQIRREWERFFPVVPIKTWKNERVNSRTKRASS